MNEPENKVLILGLGGAGGKIVSRIASQKISGLDTAVIDTDTAALDALVPEVIRLPAGSDWTWRAGSGCGGDVIRGEQAVAHERHKIAEMISGRKLILVVGGLGGGVGTGGIRTAASAIRAKEIPAVFLVTTPFSFESFARRKAAAECIDQLLPVTDILIRLPNDLLFSRISADSPVEEAFTKSCDELARTALGVCGLLNCRTALNSDYASFMAILRGRRCQCTLGTGSGAVSEQSPDRSAAALHGMLDSPFLGGAEQLKNADALIISVCAGPDLQIGEMKRTLEAVSSLTGEKTNLVTGFSTAPFMGNVMQLTVLTVKYDAVETSPEPAVSVPDPGTTVPTAKKTHRKRKIQTDLEQGLLELQSFSKGIFSGTMPVIWEDEDLDIPTFQRKGIRIDQGISGR